MMGRPLRVAWHPQDTAEALKAAYRAERDIAVRSRLHGLWLLRAGWRLRSVAEAVGVHYRTVQQWVRWYREGGLDAVVSHRQGGRGQPAYLSEQAQQDVVREVATGRFRTAAEIRDWIAVAHSVDYSMSGTYSLLGRLGCAPKVPRPVHVKADAQQQESWKRGALAVRSERRG